MESYIYSITNKINGKIYIGQHIGNNKKYFGSGKILKRAIKKYGESSFYKTIIMKGDYDKPILNELEVHFIKTYNTTDPKIGYNLTEGGEGILGHKHTVDSKNKMSVNSSGDKNPMWNKRGASHPAFGRKHSKEVTDKMRLNYLINREKYLLSRPRGKNHPSCINGVSLETRLKISNTLKRTSFFIGRKRSKEELLKQVERLSKPIIQKDLQGNFIKEWPSYVEARRKLNLKNCHISSCCRGKRKTCAGFKWEFKTPN